MPDLANYRVLSNLIEKHGGHLYEVKVHADPWELAHLDRPFSEESPQVQAAWRKLLPERNFEGWHPDAGDVIEERSGKQVRWTVYGPDGKKMESFDHPADAYRFMDKQREPMGEDLRQEATEQAAKLFGGDYNRGKRAVSDALNEQGVAGFRFLDQFSHEDSLNPTHNLVVFDPKRIEIKKINARPRREYFPHLAVPSLLAGGLGAGLLNQPEQRP